MKKILNVILDNIKTLTIALLIAILIRSLLFQPFYIPSSSMEPTLLVGDRIFVSKYVYGYSRHSFPFSPPIFQGRILDKTPARGDLVVFKTPSDNRTDYIKRLIGMPGDIIQFVDGNIFINNKKLKRTKIKFKKTIRCGKNNLRVNAFEEELPNGTRYTAVYSLYGTLQNTDKYIVPKNHYFLMGDNRDCSKDSRFLNSVGYVKDVNLVGEAKIIFFSNDTYKGSVLKIWNLKNSFRLERLFQRLK